MDGWLFALTLAAALGCAVMSGLFFAFSNFIMRALDRLPGTQGMAAMRSINVEILTPLFLLALMGTAALCVAVGVVSVFRLDEHDGPYLLAGSLLYLVGAVLLTMAYHVPRNDALEARAVIGGGLVAHERHPRAGGKASVPLAACCQCRNSHCI